MMKYFSIARRSKMNLITETKKKLTYSEAALIDLQECIEQPVTKDCLHHLREQLEATKKRIEYYSKVLKVLEKVTESEKK